VAGKGCLSKRTNFCAESERKGIIYELSLYGKNKNSSIILFSLVFSIQNEDDGVVVSSMVWAEKETRVGLLILDAVTFTEIARVTFDTPGPVPKCLHGWFSLDK